MRINLTELVAQIQLSSEDMKYYYNKETGEFVLYDEQEYGYLEDLDSLDIIFHPEWDEEVLKSLIDIRDNEENYIEVPYCNVSRGLGDREREIEYLKVALDWCSKNDILPVNAEPIITAFKCICENFINADVLHTCNIPVSISFIFKTSIQSSCK